MVPMVRVPCTVYRHSMGRGRVERKVCVCVLCVWGKKSYFLISTKSRQFIPQNLFLVFMMMIMMLMRRGGRKRIEGSMMHGKRNWLETSSCSSTLTSYIDKRKDEDGRKEE